MKKISKETKARIVIFKNGKVKCKKDGLTDKALSGMLDNDIWQYPLTTKDMYDGSKAKWQLLDEIGKWHGNPSKFVCYLTGEDIPKSEDGNEIVQTHTFEKPKTIIIKTNGLDEK